MGLKRTSYRTLCKNKIKLIGRDGYMSVLKKMMEDNKELWIDLHALISSCCICCRCHDKNTCPDGEKSYLSIYYEYSKKNPEPRPNFTDYLLRKALRAVGHKIVKIKSTYKDWHLILADYQTSITEEEYNLHKYWNEWISEVTEEEYYENDSDSESDAESTVESEVDSDNNDPN
jgi:hypothetical protein